MGNFGGIGGVDTFERGTWISPNGIYVLAVQKLLVKETRKSGDGFIVEFKVVESNHPRHAVDSKVTWIKEFMISLMHVDMSEPSEKEDFNATLEDLLDEATSYEGADSDHPLHGQTIRCETVLKKTQKGNDFTVHNWSPYDETEAAAE